MDYCVNFKETDRQIEQEESRVVKICLVKYKCILILVFAIICVLQFVLLSLGQLRDQPLNLGEYLNLVNISKNV